jgi:hypothetical protein
MEFTDLDNGRRQRTQTTDADNGGNGVNGSQHGATEPTEKTESALLFARLTGPPLAPGRRPGPRRTTVRSTQSNVLRCPPLAPLLRC